MKQHGPFMSVDKIRLPGFLLMLLAVGVIFLSLAGWHRAKLRSRVHSVPGVGDLALTAAEQKLCTEQADAGSADAAFKLALHHEMYQLNYAEGERWLTRAAALSHPEAKRWLAEIADQRRRRPALQAGESR